MGKGINRREAISLLGKGALVAGMLPYLSSCETDSIELNNKYFKNIKETILSQGLIQPEGLSMYKNGSNLKSQGVVANLEDLVFFGGGLFDDFSFSFYLAPAIYKYDSEFAKQKIFEFTDQDFYDFYSSAFHLVYVGGKTVLRPRGISRDTVVLDDGTILASSILSSKIFDVTGGTRKIFMENDELVGITSMISGQDGKIHAMQAPIIDDGYNKIRSKRGISIDPNTKEQTVEFELPDGVLVAGGDYIRNNATYGGKAIVRGNYLSMTENLGDKDDADFYAVDQLTNVGYKILGGLVTKIFDISLPSSISSDLEGNIYTVTMPILKLRNNDGMVQKSPELNVINPLTGEKTVSHVFGDGTDTKYQIGSSDKILVDGVEYVFPNGFNMSTGVVETDTTLDLYFVDSISGELGVLNAEKA